MDFYCSKLKLIIEIDGGSHLDKKDILYNTCRTEVLEKYGLKVLRFWNNDVLNGVDIIGEIINNEIEKIE